LVQVESAREADGVWRDEPADVRIIVSEGVVVQAGVAVQVLALEAQVLKIVLRETTWISSFFQQPPTNLPMQQDRQGLAHPIATNLES